MAEGRAPRATEPEFVSAVAHELRAPIAAVRAAAAQLRTPPGTLDAEARDRLLDVIGRAGDQLLRLADDLALESETRSGRLDVRIEACDARQVAAGVVSAATTSHPGADVALDAPGGLPAVAADPARLRQVLSNLVENALVHGGPGARVTVTLRGGLEALLLTVADDGPGIPTDALATVFHPHARLGERAGSGLGLWIVRELVTRMSGSITVTSDPGTGSAFTVELPLA